MANVVPISVAVATASNVRRAFRILRETFIEGEKSIEDVAWDGFPERDVDIVLLETVPQGTDAESQRRQTVPICD